ncbi:MAG: family 20 glycosylhydrolase [Clostridia bacterium]|nr:family 20 glycosylhydrolase [Clostridia bacterium]
MKGRYRFGAAVAAAARSRMTGEIFGELWRLATAGSGQISFLPEERMRFSIGAPGECAPEPGAFYTLTVSEDGILVEAAEEKGLIAGFFALLARIVPVETEAGKELFEVPVCRLSVKPPVSVRMLHLCIFPGMKLFELRRLLRFAAAAGYTHVIPEFWGTLKFDVLPVLGWKDAFTKDEIRPLFEEAREMGLEIVPMFNHWGHASASRVRHGKHVVLDQDMRCAPYFSPDGWTWNIENPKVAELLRAVRRELAALCGPGSYFHLGCDEAYNFPVTAENAHRVTEFLNGISDELKETGRRAIVWGDMFVAKREDFDPANRYTANAKDRETEAALLAGLSRDVVIADWQYRTTKAPVETALIFQKAGFDVLLCPWDGTTGCDSVTPAVKTVTDAGLLGLMHTTWHTLSRGLPTALRAAEACMGTADPALRVAPRAAALFRRVWFVNGEYGDAGWARDDLEAEPN